MNLLQPSSIDVDDEDGANSGDDSTATSSQWSFRVGQGHHNNNHMNTLGGLSPADACFGNSIDAQDAQTFVLEFNVLNKDAKALQRRMTTLMGQAGKNLNDSLIGGNGALNSGSDTENTIEALQQAHQVHLEIIRKKNAQIDLLMRREQYMVEKYEKMIAEKDESLHVAENRIHVLETTAVTEAVEEAIKSFAVKNGALRTPIMTILKHTKQLRNQVFGIAALVRQEQKVLNILSQRMQWQAYERIEQKNTPDSVLSSLDAELEHARNNESGDATSPFRLSDKGIQLYNQLAELLGGMKQFTHIDHLMERAVSYVAELKIQKSTHNVVKRESRKETKVVGGGRSIGVQAEFEVVPPAPYTSTTPPPQPKSVLEIGKPEEGPKGLKDHIEEVTHRLEQPHVTEPQKKQLREVLAEAKAITKESAAVTMRSVVESVRERRQLQTLHEMYAQEVKKPQPTGSTGVHRPIPRHVFCHQCGKGPFPLQRTWRCTNCYERLHRPPLMTMKRLMESKPVVERRNQTNAVDEKYASLFRRIEEHRARREAKLEETRRRLREDQIRILQKIKLILISCAPLRTPISSVPHFQPQTLSTRGTQQQQSSTTTTTAPLPDCLTFKVSALRGGPSRGNGVPGITPQVSQQHQQRSILGGGMRPPILPHYQPQRLEMPSLIQGQKMTDKKK